MIERQFPIQQSTDRARKHPRAIPWSMAEVAYWSYEGRYGSEQSLERMAERGGYGWDEFCELFTFAHLGMDLWGRQMETKRRHPLAPSFDRLTSSEPFNSGVDGE